MATSDPSESTTRFSWAVGIVLAAVCVWVLFFDSHSVLKRYYWHQELESLNRENEQLRRDIERLRTKLDKPLADSVVERIAREEYGMKRPGETIYQIKKK